MNGEEQEEDREPDDEEAEFRLRRKERTVDFYLHGSSK